MKTTEEYSGWTNRATWEASMEYEEVFRDILEHGIRLSTLSFDDAIDEAATRFESLVKELELLDLKPNSRAAYLVASWIEEIDFLDIAQTFLNDFPAEAFLQEETDEEEPL